MTIEQIKNWLNRPKEIENQIKYKQSLIDFWRERQGSQVFSYTQSNNPKSCVEVAIVKIDEINQEINDLLHEYIHLIDKIEYVLVNIKDKNLSRLLLMRYIEKRSWKEIASELSYSTSYLRHQLHEEALNEILKLKP